MKREEYLKMVKENSLNLKFVPSQYQDREICLTAVRQNGWALEYIKNQTREICLEAVRRTGYALQFVEKQDKEICVEAIKQNISALYYVEEQDKEICLMAVKQNCRALEYIEEQDKEICLEAVKRIGCALKYVKEQDKEICLASVKQNILALQYVDKKYIDEVKKELNVFYLQPTEEHRELIIDSKRRCWIGCQEGISIVKLVDRIYNERGGLKENPHRKYYLDFLGKNNLF